MKLTEERNGKTELPLISPRELFSWERFIGCQSDHGKNGVDVRSNIYDTSDPSIELEVLSSRHEIERVELRTNFG